uniref:Uncharacterized protein n=1 Tax=Meloidogyne incognita TaxID=6306 RepID=A0A914NHN3_MELIC
MLCIQTSFVIATTEEDIEKAKTNLHVDSAVHKCLKDAYETLAKLFEEDVVLVNRQNLDELTSAPYTSNRFVGVIRHFTRSLSLNDSRNVYSESKSAPTSPSGSAPPSPSGSRLGSAKQYFRSVSFNEPIRTTASSSSSSTPSSPSSGGGVLGFVRQLSLNAASQALSPRESSNKTYKRMSSFKLNEGLIVANATAYLSVEIKNLREILDKIYETFKDIPKELKNKVPFNLREDNFPYIINRQLISNLDIWLMRFERISQENKEYNLCGHFYPNEKGWIREELNKLLVDEFYSGLKAQNVF